MRQPNLEPLPTDPTPEQITAGCERIRQRWSNSERRKRAAWAVSEPVTAPEVEVFDDEATGA